MNDITLTTEIGFFLLTVGHGNSLLAFIANSVSRIVLFLSAQREH